MLYIRQYPISYLRNVLNAAGYVVWFNVIVSITLHSEILALAYKTSNRALNRETNCQAMVRLRHI